MLKALAVEDTEDSDSENAEQTPGVADYDYLVGMSMWNLTKEKKDDILKKKNEKVGKHN